MFGNVNQLDVLLVDNDPSIRLLLAIVLNDAFPGIHIEVATNGAEAIDKMKDWRPRLVLTNVVLPAVDGELILAWTRAFQPGTPVVAMSAMRSRAPFDDFLSIPAELDDLARRLRRWLPVACLTDSVVRMRESFPGLSSRTMGEADSFRDWEAAT